MTNLTLKQLRYFEALAAQGHFGRAADLCAVSQPALSVQIKQMEEELGGALFERGARAVRLTPLGEALAGRAGDILRAVEEFEAIAHTARDGRVTRLRIGVIPTIAPYLLPGIIGALQVSAPGLDLHVRETQTARLITELIAGRIDAAIVALPVSEPALTEVALFEESFVLVRPAQDAGQPVPDPAALHKMRLLLLEEGHCFRDQALAFCNMPTARPHEGLEGSSLSTLVQMVSSGIGVTLIPDMAVGVETRSAQVAVSRFPDPQPRRTIGMIWRTSTPLAEHLHGLCDTVRQVAHR